MKQKIIQFIDSYSDYAIWGIAVIGMFGSLYYSEIVGLYPCTLCWYQRILLYPFVAIYAVAILMKDKKVAYYGLPLALIGTIMAFYQSLLQWGILKESELTCSVNSAVSCSDNQQVNWFGFINIPFMSFMAFAIILALIIFRIILIKENNRK
jgi:disulfide bond formation protein DsbB